MIQLGVDALDVPVNKVPELIANSLRETLTLTFADTSEPMEAMLVACDE